MQRKIDELEENLEMKCSEIDELKKKLYNKENSLAECSLVIFGDSGRYFGLYRYCAEASCYKQISRKSDKHRFLFRSLSSGCWFVGSVPYDEDAGVWMENDNSGISVPLTGWMVSDLGSWRVDPSIRIVTGVRLEPEAFPDVEIKLEGFADVWWSVLQEGGLLQRKRYLL